jgi:hypothetical protein
MLDAAGSVQSEAVHILQLWPPQLLEGARPLTELRSQQNPIIN